MTTKAEPSEKSRLRTQAWDAMQRARVALFPGARGRIPNFKGASDAARRLASLPEWVRAATLKCNPDAPQRPVRHLALKQGKIVYMAVPRLRDEACFVELDPRRLDPKSLYDASSIQGAFRQGLPIHPSKMPHVDLIVAGSVAVSPRGRRVGKGGGYSDVEFALGRAFGFVDDGTVVCTTVHDLQVVEDEFQTQPHDIVLDLIVTPSRVLRTETPYLRPVGIDWSLVSGDMLDEIPILRQLKKGRSGR